MADYEYAVEYPHAGAVYEPTLDRDEAVQELLWAMTQREILYAKEDYLAGTYSQAYVVVRERADELDDWGPWAVADVTEEELDAARELAGEVD